jgi:hypothetical protein
MSWQKQPKRACRQGNPNEDIAALTEQKKQELARVPASCCRFRGSSTARTLRTRRRTLSAASLKLFHLLYCYGSGMLLLLHESPSCSSTA